MQPDTGCIEGKCSNSRIECEQSTLAADVVLEGGGRMDPCEGGAGATGHLPNGKGGILYCVIARGATVLARLS